VCVCVSTRRNTIFFLVVYLSSVQLFMLHVPSRLQDHKCECPAARHLPQAKMAHQKTTHCLRRRSPGPTLRPLVSIRASHALYVTKSDNIDYGLGKPITVCSPVSSLSLRQPPFFLRVSVPSLNNRAYWCLSRAQSPPLTSLLRGVREFLTSPE